MFTRKKESLRLSLLWVLESVFMLHYQMGVCLKGHYVCVCVCVGFRVIMGMCECWIQVINAGTLESGRQSDGRSANVKRGEG